MCCWPGFMRLAYSLSVVHCSPDELEEKRSSSASLSLFALSSFTPNLIDLPNCS